MLKNKLASVTLLLLSACAGTITPQQVEHYTETVLVGYCTTLAETDPEIANLCAVLPATQAAAQSTLDLVTNLLKTKHNTCLVIK